MLAAELDSKTPYKPEFGLTDVQAERDLCLIWRHDSRLPAVGRAFLEVLHAQASHGKARET